MTRGCRSARTPPLTHAPRHRNPHPSMAALHAALVGARTSDDETRD